MVVHTCSPLLSCCCVFLTLWSLSHSGVHSSHSPSRSIRAAARSSFVGVQRAISHWICRRQVSSARIIGSGGKSTACSLRFWQDHCNLLTLTASVTRRASSESPANDSHHNLSKSSLVWLVWSMLFLAAMKCSLQRRVDGNSSIPQWSMNHGKPPSAAAVRAQR